MKTTLKKVASLLVVLVAMISFNQAKAQTSYNYYVPTAWEHQYGKSDGQPIVANVVKLKANCPAGEVQIANDLSDHYKAYYSKSRGFTGTNSAIVLGPYKTYDEAQKARTKKIADYNYKWNPLIINDFSTSCNE